MKTDNARKKIIFSYLAIPIASSLISTWHIVSFFDVGNPYWMAVVLAITFEVGALASFVSFSVIDKLKGALWSVYLIFIILFSTQMVGNVYFSFDYVTRKLIEQSSHIAIFKEFLDSTFLLFANKPPDPTYVKYVLSCIMGVPIPIVSISFLHLLMKYLSKPDITPDATAVPDVHIPVAVQEQTKPDDDDTKSDIDDTKSDIDDKGHGVVVEH